MDPYTSVWNRKLLRLCVFLKTSSIINLPQPLKMTLIGRVCLHSAELIKWQKSARLTVNLCIHTLSLPSITANSSDRWSKKEDDVVLDWGSPSSQLLRRWIMVIFMLPGDVLQPPPGSVGAVVVVEGYVTYNVRACTCLWWYLSVRTCELIVKVLAVISGSSNLEPRGSRRRQRQNRRTRRLLCTEPEQLKWQHRQMAVSDQVIDWTRLVLFSQTGNKWHIQVADVVPAQLFSI